MLCECWRQRWPNRRDWSRLSRGWSDRIDARIAELERLKLGLTECIGCGCLSLDRCRLANPGDRAARLGSGPRYWLGDPRPAAPHIESSGRGREPASLGSEGRDGISAMAVFEGRPLG